MPKLLLLTFVVAVALTAASHSGLRLHPLRRPGRRVAAQRPRLARGAGRQARRARRRHRPLHDSLGPGGPPEAAQRPFTLDPAYGWENTDAVLHELRAHGIAPLVTLLGAPRWANGGRSFNWAPRSGASFASFAYATQKRYPFVRDWLIWNEPNEAPLAAADLGLRLRLPAPEPGLHGDQALLLPVGPRRRRVTWRRAARPAVFLQCAGIRGMGRGPRPAGRLPASPSVPAEAVLETPTSGGCTHCETNTMATLERLISEVRAPSATSGSG